MKVGRFLVSLYACRNCFDLTNKYYGDIIACCKACADKVAKERKDESKKK